MSEDVVWQKFPQYPRWLTGEESPTVKQLEKFAAQTYTPLGFFFLSEPPVEPLPIPDFRTVKDQGVTQPSPHLLDTIYAAQLRQAWMRSFLMERGEPALPFAGCRSLKDKPEAVAADIRHTLGLEVRWSRALSTWEEALRTLIRKIEDVEFHSEVVADYEMGGDRKLPESREKAGAWNVFDLFGKRSHSPH